MAYAYTTPELVQSELQGASPFTSDTLPSLQDVNDWIEEESAYVNTIAAQIFGSELVEDEFVDLSGDDDILLPVSPIISISSLYYNTRSLTNSQGANWVEKIEDTDFIVYKDVGRIHILRDRWVPHPGRRRVKITYTYGYATAPLTVRMLVSKLVAKRVIDSILYGKLREGDMGEVSIGTLRVVEPRDLSVSTYRKLDEDIDRLKKRIHDGFKVFRPIVL